MPLPAPSDPMAQLMGLEDAAADQELLPDIPDAEMEEEVEEPAVYSLPAPEGFMPPSTARNGESFDIVAKARLQDGMLIFDAFNGIPLGGAAAPSGNMTLEQAVSAQGY